MSGVRDPRVLFGRVVLLSALVAGSCGGGTDSPSGDTDRPDRAVRAELTLERAGPPTTAQPELLVSLPDARLNNLRTSGGETSVLLRCVDKAGRVTIRQNHEWPLLEELGFAPHVHQPATPEVLDSLRSCRLTGNGIDFAGSAPRGLAAAR